MQTIRWGVLGTGHIANTVSSAIEAVDGTEVYAVASRSLEKAESFIDAHHASVAYGSYQELVCDKNVDIVYIATPHSEHYANAVLCINAGKNVLCEKPIAPNAAQAREIAELAQGKNVFLMEAIWTKFLPAIQKAMSWIQEGKIGEPRMLEAGFCFRSEPDPKNRLFDPSRAGGALLDVGVYPLNLASLVFGYDPEKICGTATIGSTGVDEQGAALLKYKSGALACTEFAIRTDARNDAVIYGTEGEIRIPRFWSAERAEIWKDGSLAEQYERHFVKNGYEYEIMAVCDCLRHGEAECKTASVRDSIKILEMTDKLRRSWGERYPFE